MDSQKTPKLAKILDVYDKSEVKVIVSIGELNRMQKLISDLTFENEKLKYQLEHQFDL